MNTNARSAPECKVEPDDLRSFAGRSDDAVRQVLIQVKMSPAQVQMAPARLGHNRWRGMSFGSAAGRSAEGHASVRHVCNELERLGIAARYLPSAEAFVAKLTPAQIRDLCELSSVQRIIPDRERKLDSTGSPAI
jgi:hypothetical protein